MSISHLRVIRDEEAPAYDAPAKRATGFAMIPRLVLETNNGTMIAVYAVLARHANQSGECWPSMKLLETETGWSETRIRPALERLISEGFVGRSKRKLNGMDQSNVYTIHPNVQVPHSEVAVPQGEVLGTSPHRLGYLTTRDELEPVELKPIEPDIPPQSPQGDDPKKTQRKSRPKPNDLDGFEEWYQKYPRRVARGEAEKAWAKMSGDERSAAMDGLRKHLPGLLRKEKEYIAHPATWLRGKRWLDEPEPQLNQFGQRMWTLEEEAAEVNKSNLWGHINLEGRT